MQESCPYGSVRGAPSNGCPYRNRVLEPSQFIRLLDTAFAFYRRDRPKSGTEAISVKRKESGGLPIAVGCTRSKTGRVPCLHICWAEQCEPDILLYRGHFEPQ